MEHTSIMKLPKYGTSEELKTCIVKTGSEMCCFSIEAGYHGILTCSEWVYRHLQSTFPSTWFLSTISWI